MVSEALRKILISLFKEKKRKKYDLLFSFLEQNGFSVSDYPPSVIYEYVQIIMPEIAGYFSPEDLYQPIQRIYGGKTQKNKAQGGAERGKDSVSPRSKISELLSSESIKQNDKLKDVF